VKARRGIRFTPPLGRPVARASWTLGKQRRALLQRLSQLNDWPLEESDQAILGRHLLDQQRRPIGTITDMIVDIDAKPRRMVGAVLDTGVEYPATDYEMHGGEFVLLPGVEVRHRPA
jgi:hypothetical protein